MKRLLTLSLILLAPASIRAADDEAKKQAQEILTRGATLFDTRDAVAMASTYTEDAELSLVSKDKDTGTYKAQDTHGRTAIERFYQDFFKDRDSSTKSRNNVEYAHFVGNDLLIIQGTFTPDVSKNDSFAFVQVRAKKGDKWLILNLQLFIIMD
jgi:ketosteroid isomerase-like protein